MANYCDYEIRVIGTENAGYMIYSSTPCVDCKEIIDINQNGLIYETIFSGKCKWSVNYGVRENCPSIDITNMTRNQIADIGNTLWYYSLRSKSQMLQCEIIVHYWSRESEFDQLDHFKNGLVLRQRKIKYSPDNVVDWKQVEFIGHEGEYDKSVDGEAQNNKYMAAMLSIPNAKAIEGEPRLLDVLNATTGYDSKKYKEGEQLATGAGIDLDDSPIGDTEWDAFNWTFTNGVTYKGGGWNVTVPDGFIVRRSNEGIPRTCKKREFEMIPIGFKINSRKKAMPLYILDGGKRETYLKKNSWPYHLTARKGYAYYLSTKFAKDTALMLDCPPDVLATAWDDLFAVIQVHDTGSESYSFICQVYSEKEIQTFRVQTGSMTAEQKKRLAKSVIKWIETVKYDTPNYNCPKSAVISRDTVFNPIMDRHDLSLFKEAIEQAKVECETAVYGYRYAMLYEYEIGFIDKEEYEERLKTNLNEGLEVIEYYYEKIDEVINRIIAADIPVDTAKKVFKIIHENLDDGFFEVLNERELRVLSSPTISKIKKEWRKKELNLDR